MTTDETTADELAIDARGVVKSYSDQVVLHGADLAVRRGTLTALVGPNGAGKSTLLAIVARLLEPDSGTITVDGLDVRSARSRQVARHLAVLRQDNHLSARLTVADLVGFGRFPHAGRSLGATDRDAVARAIEFFELDELRDRYLDELSGGQRQRAFAAMVLAQDTPVILLDEPLNNLDMRHAVQMMRLLRRLVDEDDRTVVIVLHDINFAAAYADRIVAMAGGRVIVDGTPDEVIASAPLASIYGFRIPVHVVGGRRYALYYRP